MSINPKIDEYLDNGCGRCDLYATPECKVNTWRNELIELRRIVLSTRLTEEHKWSQPCYTHNGKNLIIVAAFKDYAFVSFFKGALLKDPDGVLHKPGQNSNSVRLFRFTSVEQVLENEDLIKAFIFETIDNENAGLSIPPQKLSDINIPEELLILFDEDPSFEAAWESLTPGRRKSWLIHFNQAKQSKTRVSRIEKAKDKIFNGKGWQER